jgi:type I restriction enzyme M protein
MDAQSLRSTIKTCRDLMRKDEGLSSDVERLPQFSWMLFLKCFSDHEKKREVLSKKYVRVLPTKLRWGNWANNSKLQGEELISFVNKTLFPELAKLTEQKDIQKQHIGSIFKGFVNRVESPTILREIISKINELDFTSSDDIHTMAKMYEDMLIEMKDAAGQNGEFYTPRPVIRFITNVIKPSLKKGEMVLDPACGTGGFLAESLDFMKKDVKTNSDLKKLHSSLNGYEKKPLPYLLGMMNLILHEINDPNITRQNTLGTKISEIKSSDQFDIVMTNPPFGGEEESLIAKNLPIEFKTSDTALGFFVYIMNILKKNGRCGIILPNGPMFAGGVAGKIKEKLLKEFNLHTIVRLPTTVFEPYTTIATNILFFEKGKPTKDIWYYQMSVAERLRGATRAKNPKYTKSNPISYEDFADVLKWLKKKTPNENAWKVSVKDIKDFNLDVKNPNDVEETMDLAPHELIDNIIADEEKTMKLLKEVKELIKKEIPK